MLIKKYKQYTDRLGIIGIYLINIYRYTFKTIYKQIYDMIIKLIIEHLETTTKN